MLAAPLTTNTQRAEGEQLDGLTARLTPGLRGRTPRTAGTSRCRSKRPPRYRTADVKLRVCRDIYPLGRRDAFKPQQDAKRQETRLFDGAEQLPRSGSPSRVSPAQQRAGDTRVFGERPQCSSASVPLRTARRVFNYLL